MVSLGIFVLYDVGNENYTANDLYRKYQGQPNAKLDFPGFMAENMHSKDSSKGTAKDGNKNKYTFPYAPTVIYSSFLIRTHK